MKMDKSEKFKIVEELALEKFRNKYARELSISDLKELLEVKKSLSEMAVELDI